MDSRRLDGHQGVQRLDGAFYREDHEVQIMFEYGTQRMDQVEDWSGTSVLREEDSSWVLVELLSKVKLDEEKIAGKRKLED